MDNYSVPMFSDNSFSLVSGESASVSITDDNSAATTNSHHNGDPMLAAGDTAIAIIHQVQNNKSQTTNIKDGDDYTTFTKCIQQTFLEHRPVESNVVVDTGVSLGGLCDLKFTNSTLLGASPLNVLTAVEPNQMHLSKIANSTSAIVSHSQEMCYDTTNWDVVNIKSKSIQRENDAESALSTSPPQYLTLNCSNQTKSHIENNSQISPMTVITTNSNCSTPSLVSLNGNHTKVPSEIPTANFSLKCSTSDLLNVDPTSMSSVIMSATINFPDGGSCSSTTNLNNYDANLQFCSSAPSVSILSAAPINNETQQPSPQLPPPPPTCIISAEEHHKVQCEITRSDHKPKATTSSLSMITAITKETETITRFNSQLRTEKPLEKTDEFPRNLCSSSSCKSKAEMIVDDVHNQEILQVNSSSECESLTPSTSDDEDNDSEFININMDKNGNGGYQENTSSNSQQSANGGNGGGSVSGAAGVAACANNAYAVIQGGSNSNVSNNGPGNGAAGNGNSNNGGTNYMTLLPPAVGSACSSAHMSSNQSGGTSATAGVSSDIIDFKHLFEELCPVCSDKVSGYHYGLLTCESCKGFFKRTVQNKKVYTCVAERSCHIDKTQRKRCPYCRFQKCLEVGMKLEAVRADRMRGGRNKFGPMYKRDRARKLQLMRQRQLALQALRTMGSADIKPTPVSIGYQQGYPNMNIKQEIQIPQVSSLTQSPDSSPSPIAIALGQVSVSTGVIATPNSAGASGGVNNSSSSGNSGNASSESVSRGGTSGCQDNDIGSLHTASESKICFDSGTHPSSTADSMIEPLRVSPMIRDFVQSIDDREWQTQLFALLQKQTYNQVEVDLFELLCKVLDQNLFSQVDWARNTVFFKDLKVDDQMKLLQHSWSDMLVLDHLHQRIHNGLPDETQLNNGQVFNLLSLGLLGVSQLSDFFNELQNKLQDLKFDMGDYVCMKFLILLNPDVRGIINKKTVLEGHENVQAALLDYTLTCYPSVTDKFRRLLNILPEIHAMAARGEEHLYSKHCAGSAPTQTLLMEMLHAKRKV